MGKRTHRSPVAATPIAVSQATSEAVLGVDGRRFLEVVVPKCSHVSHVGRLRVVRVDDALEALAGLVGEEPMEDARADADDGIPETVDGVLAKLGHRRAR